MLIDLIAGARPNFMKIAPIIEAIKKSQNEGSKLQYRLVHTGQHYDKAMSDSFFEQLNIPSPDFNLGAGSGTQAEQTAAIMIAYEKLLFERKSDLCLVVGDVTSTLACAITAKKLHIKVAHVEGGIRSGDRMMPEEINRLVTDSISDYFFTTTSSAGENLYKEGIKEEQIFWVGNTMIDTLIANIPRLNQPKSVWESNQLRIGEYIILTLHRPNNVDSPIQLELLLDTLLNYNPSVRFVFPMHPRTQKIFKEIKKTYKNLIIIEPQGYLEFNYLVKNSLGVVTDSGGITEETTYLHIPCITLRDSTERPETCTIGTNELIGTDPNQAIPYLEKMIQKNWKKGSIPEKWDGNTSTRIVEILNTLANS
jgi:UDP-N-acetylglucosamine 2-epimerase (non-hydrolysing)